MQKEKRPTKEQKRPAYRAYLTVLAITLQSIAKRDLLSHMTCVLLLTYLQCIPDSAGRYPAAIREQCRWRPGTCLYYCGRCLRHLHTSVHTCGKIVGPLGAARTCTKSYSTRPCCASVVAPPPCSVHRRPVVWFSCSSLV